MGKTATDVKGLMQVLALMTRFSAEPCAWGIPWEDYRRWHIQSGFTAVRARRAICCHIKPH